jgi:large subunit ribosomal protein L21
VKQAIISSGGKQYLVSEGEQVEVELINSDDKKLSFKPLLVIDGDKTLVGQPEVAGVSVTAEVVEADVKADKVTAIRYKAKKRVHKVHGHRQHHTVIKISKIA